MFSYPNQRNKQIKTLFTFKINTIYFFKIIYFIVVTYVENTVFCKAYLTEVSSMRLFFNYS